jgi:large subunit ribosomal protein L20
MPRVKRAVGAKKKRKKTLSQTKGFMWGRKNKYRLAKDALRHAGVHAYKDRRLKKRDNRQLWNVQINAAVRGEGLTYSKFINALKKKDIELDRKILSDLAQNNPEIFSRIVETVK